MNNNEIGILVIEDEEDIRTLVMFHLRRDGFAVAGAADGEEGLRLFDEGRPHLVVLDLMLPGMDGLAVCREIRQSGYGAKTPVIMLTARDSDNDIVTGLENGADDYLAKPFNHRVLLARVHSLLRRSGHIDFVADGESEMVLGDIRLFPDRRDVTVSGRRVILTHGEFKMLHVMMRRPGVVFSRSELLELVGGGNPRMATERAVDVQVVGLRKKLGRSGTRVETVRGMGYRLVSA